MVESKKWREEDGKIYFSVVSDGTTGPEWIERLKKNGCKVEESAKNILRSNGFNPTIGGITTVVVLKNELFEENDRNTKNIRVEADKRNFVKPNAEIACLIREKFLDKEIEDMGISTIVVMHEPIKDSGYCREFFVVGHYIHDQFHVQCLNNCCDYPGGNWYGRIGFAFTVATPKV